MPVMWTSYQGGASCSGNNFDDFLRSHCWWLCKRRKHGVFGQQLVDADGGAAVSSPAMSVVVAAMIPRLDVVRSAADESNSMDEPNSTGRIVGGVEEETLDTCLAHIPQDATAGQKMMAEQTCRRDFSVRR